MEFQNIAEELSHEFIDATTETALHASLTRASRRMGFDHFALSLDPRPWGDIQRGVLVHDYPDEWARVYVSFDLAGADPVRRACDKAMVGFEWAALERMIPMTRRDRQMLAVGRECGVADGYTIPRHLPGELSGSCSFVMRQAAALPRTMLLVAELVGAFALTSAGRIAELVRAPARPILSDRQRECLLWSARGKTAVEIAIILGISEETVIQHLKLARERYDVHCRQSLILRALFDGLIGFGDIFRWRGAT